MISDGCGYNQVDAASLYQYGKTGIQVYEHFPVELAMATFMDLGNYDSEMAWEDFQYVASDATDSAAAVMLLIQQRLPLLCLQEKKRIVELLVLTRMVFL
jgi:alkaline phosphatase